MTTFKRHMFNFLAGCIVGAAVFLALSGVALLVAALVWFAVVAPEALVLVVGFGFSAIFLLAVGWALRYIDAGKGGEK